jgi:hypothetical protein
MPDNRAPELTAEDWEMIQAVGRRIAARQFEAFTAQGLGCGWCRHPIRIRGVVMADDGGEHTVRFSTAGLPDGVTLKACGSRRETRCPACAAVYRADARHLVRAGLVGGKGVDESVAAHPAVLLTLTAPSFGAVHASVPKGPCHPSRSNGPCVHGRAVSCFERHRADEELVGIPLCADCYDYEGAVLHNAATPELWRRTTIYLFRHLAAVLGRTQADTKALCSLSFCRVAEFQRRGVVHLHAVIRADGPDAAPPPLTAKVLAEAAVSAARSVRVTHPRGNARWGEQLDAQVLQRDGDRAKEVAGYVAKYATKSSDEGGVLDGRIRAAEDLARRPLRPHVRRMVETAWNLGADPALESLHLRQHAHTFGYGGHFLSKSRRYSTSFAALREARANWQEAQRHGDDAAADRSLTCRWRALGAGWANQGEVVWAEHQQRQRADDRKAFDEDRYSTTASEMEEMQ